MRKYMKLFAVICACLLICSCAQKKYRSDVSCRELCDLAQNSIDDGLEYEEYGESHLKYEFGDGALGADDFCIVYSVKVEDINEIGVFFADGEERVKEIAKDCREYLEDMRENKGAFISSYAPLEMPKLDKAGVRVYGNYVIYAVTDEDLAENAFEEIEKRLTVR